MTMLASYDGWWASGTAIAGVARGSIPATINPTSCITIIVTPTGN